MSDLWLEAHILYRRVPGHRYTFRINKHLHSEEFIGRDYFPGVNSSLFRRIFLQGLFSLSEFIPIRKNFSTGIIFPSQIHPHSKEFISRDYFPRVNSSLFGKIFRQGLFSWAKFIPTQKNSPPGIIFPRQNHPHTKESIGRDYFPEPNSSLFGRIRLQGCFGNIEGLHQIPESNFRMHGDRKPHPDSRDISRCDHW